MNIEMVIVKSEIKVDSEEFSDANDDQANYNGTRWIIICSSTVLMLYRFDCCFYYLFHDYVSILIKYQQWHTHGGCQGAMAPLKPERQGDKLSFDPPPFEVI